MSEIKVGRFGSSWAPSSWNAESCLLILILTLQTDEDLMSLSLLIRALNPLQRLHPQTSSKSNYLTTTASPNMITLEIRTAAY